MAATEETNKTTTTRKPVKVKEMSDRQRIITLAAGDALAFLIFSAYGRYSHGEPGGLTAIPQIILTALPFAIGWFLVSPFVGAFRRDLVAQPRSMAIRTTLAWVFSWPVGLALRGLFVDHGIPPLPFAIVTLLFNLAILLIWRWPFALNNSLRQRG